ncbi:MAG: hypothetical protein QGI78_08960 [Phycisphaerales bacterium]|jgi:hypothetical protein|nr:hypothetical protein [Phycisphaerales bacterium]
MTIYCDDDALPDVLARDDWVVSEQFDRITIGIDAGCKTAYIGNYTKEINPSFYAPSVACAEQCIAAFGELR